MRTDDPSGQDKFDRLLDWLDSDKDRAGTRYVEIREGLVRFFTVKGCFDAESMADETIDRVTARIDSLILDTSTRTIYVFYGFAKNVYLESLRAENRAPFQLDESISQNVTEDDQRQKDRFACLEKCVSKLGKGEVEMTVKYFSNTGGERITARQRIADEMGITNGNLRIRVLRIRESLRKCVQKCIDSR